MKTRYFLILITLLFVSCKTTKVAVSDNADIKVTDIETHYLLSDQNADKYYLILLMRKLQSEKKLGEIPMLIVDSKPIFHFYKKDFEPANVQKNQIRKIKTEEAEKCVQLYGAACKYGLITVNTYGTQENLPDYR